MRIAVGLLCPFTLTPFLPGNTQLLGDGLNHARCRAFTLVEGRCFFRIQHANAAAAKTTVEKQGGTQAGHACADNEDFFLDVWIGRIHRVVIEPSGNKKA